MEPRSQGTTPLAVSHDLGSPSPAKPDRTKRSRKRKLLCCCGICSSIVIILIVILIILIFTVFKRRDPSIHVDSVTLQELNVDLGNIFTNFGISVELDLATNVTVDNPNYASFKYRNTTAYLYYRGKMIGDSPISAGKVKARGHSKVSTTTSVRISGALINANLTRDVTAGVLPLQTELRIKGSAKVINLFEVKNVRTDTHCDVNIYILNQTQSFNCDYDLKL